MKESKLQRLHDTLKKLAPKGNHGGLGSASLVKGGFKHKDNGLPKNGLYSYFVKPGHFRKTFDDSSSSDDDSEKKAARKLKRRQEKEARKAEKKAKKKREKGTSAASEDEGGSSGPEGTSASQNKGLKRKRKSKRSPASSAANGISTETIAKRCGAAKEGDLAGGEKKVEKSKVKNKINKQPKSSESASSEGGVVATDEGVGGGEKSGKKARGKRTAKVEEELNAKVKKKTKDLARDKGGGCGKKEGEDQEEGVGEEGSVLALKSKGKRKRKKSTASSSSLADGADQELNGAAPTKRANRARLHVAAEDDGVEGGDGGEGTGLNRGGKLKPHKEGGRRRTTPSGDAATVDGTTNGDAGERGKRKRKGEVQGVSDPVTPKSKKANRDGKKGASKEKTSKVDKKKRKKDEDTGGDDAGGDGASSGVVEVRKRLKIKRPTVGAYEGREEGARSDGDSDEECRTREGRGGKKRKRVKDDSSQGEAKDDKGRGGVSGGKGGFHPKYREGSVKGRKAGKEKKGLTGNQASNATVQLATGLEEASPKRKKKKAVAAKKARGREDEDAPSVTEGNKARGREDEDAPSVTEGNKKKKQKKNA